METIAPIKFNVNVKGSRVTKAPIIQAAAISEKIEENTLSWESVRFIGKNIFSRLSLSDFMQIKKSRRKISENQFRICVNQNKNLCKPI